MVHYPHYLGTGECSQEDVYVPTVRDPASSRHRVHHVLWDPIFLGQKGGCERKIAY
jgi:hypothetical protein